MQWLSKGTLPALLKLTVTSMWQLGMDRYKEGCKGKYYRVLYKAMNIFLFSNR